MLTTGVSVIYRARRDCAHALYITASFRPLPDRPPTAWMK